MIDRGQRNRLKGFHVLILGRTPDRVKGDSRSNSLLYDVCYLVLGAQVTHGWPKDSNTTRLFQNQCREIRGKDTISLGAIFKGRPLADREKHDQHLTCTLIT